MMLLLLSMSSSLKNKVSNLRLMLNITRIWLPVIEKLTVLLTKETLTPLLKLNVKRLSLIPKVSSLMLKLNLPLPSKILLSLPRLSLMVPP